MNRPKNGTVTCRIASDRDAPNTESAPLIHATAGRSSGFRIVLRIAPSPRSIDRKLNFRSSSREWSHRPTLTDISPGFRGGDSSSPITAAGPRWNYTIFPSPRGDHRRRSYSLVETAGPCEQSLLPRDFGRCSQWTRSSQTKSGWSVRPAAFQKTFTAARLLEGSRPEDCRVQFSCSSGNRLETGSTFLFACSARLADGVRSEVPHRGTTTFTDRSASTRRRLISCHLSNRWTGTPRRTPRI